MATKKIDGKAYSIGEILKRGFQYRVPTYQRDFAWTVDEIEVLWLDILRAMANEKRDYFIGAIVTSQTSEKKKRDIVDGQQRLAALSMLFSAIANAWKSRNDIVRSTSVSKDYLGDSDRRTQEVTPKLSLNENNDAFFQQHIVSISEKPISLDSKAKKSLINSNRLILQGFEIIKELLSFWLKGFAESDVEENLISLEEFVSDNIYAIVIETGDESDAFVTFEALNGRGLDLATSDLVKNLLFSKAGANIENFKKDWNEIVLLIGGNGLTQYLRYFWNAYYGVSREKELYRSIKDQISEPRDAKVMMDRLKKAALYYDALTNIEHPYWVDFPKEYKVYLNGLNLFNFTQYRPVALAAMDVMTAEDFTKLLKIIYIISFRYTVISALNTGNLDKVYSNTALAITANPGIRPKAIFEKMKSLYVDDAKFESNFKGKYFSSESIARYVLKELNGQIPGNEELKPSDRVTLEHILPKNPSPEWDKYIGKNNAEDLVYLIGNLTLLESTKNRSIGNASFEVKKEKAFVTSKLSINESVKSQMFWTSKEIETRSTMLAKLATQKWRLEY